MENKQSSIEWLTNKICDYLIEKYGIDYYDYDLVEQAKAMHKEEIIKSNRAGIDMVIDKEKYRNFRDDFFYVSGEEYYNETFGGEQC